MRHTLPPDSKLSITFAVHQSGIEVFAVVFSHLIFDFQVVKEGLCLLSEGHLMLWNVGNSRSWNSKERKDSLLPAAISDFVSHFFLTS